MRWRRRRLEEALAAQVALGEEIFDATPRFSRKRVLAWSDRNREILYGAFTTEEILYEYDYEVTLPIEDDHWRFDQPRDGTEWPTQLEGHPPEAMLVPLEEFYFPADRHKLEQGLMQLREIADRLDLYEEVAEVFVVHGRDHGTRDTVARALRQLTGDEPVILQEQPDGGDTVIEKFERHAGAVAAAVVIVTPDDVGGLAGSDMPLQPRARQNVIFELGWFQGRLGRGRVIALLVDDVELPSDITGVLYLPIDPAGAWRYRLGHELAHMGLDVDLHRLR
jgi:hypothetical protein